MNYISYISKIKKELMKLGVKSDVALSKARSCRGFYISDNKYIPVKDAVAFCIRRMQLIEFSIAGLKQIQKEYEDRAYEITVFLAGRKDKLTPVEDERVYEWGNCA